MALLLNHPPLFAPGVLELRRAESWDSRLRSRRRSRVSASMSLETETAYAYIPAAPILLPEGPWKQIPGGVTAAKGFKAAGIYGGLRAAGEKPDLALVTCDTDAISAGKDLKCECAP